MCGGTHSQPPRLNTTVAGSVRWPPLPVSITPLPFVGSVLCAGRGGSKKRVDRGQRSQRRELLA